MVVILFKRLREDSYLNKTTSNDMSELNNTTTLTPHSKSVNFMGNVSSYVPQSSSLFEDYDKDQEQYNSLKKQVRGSMKQNRSISLSTKSDTKSNTTDRSNVNQYKNGTIPKSVVTFFIGADDTPFKCVESECE